MRHWLKALSKAEDSVARGCAATLLMYCADQRVWPLLDEGEQGRKLPDFAKLLGSSRMRRAVKDVLKERNKRLLGYQNTNWTPDWIKPHQRSCVTLRL